MTEDALMYNIDQTIPLLERLREAGRQPVDRRLRHRLFVSSPTCGACRWTR
ncbi:hypothetical protein ACPA9J_31665 [Pseudomonas aeruginosa]